MDFTFRCNFLKCRAVLDDCAIVTTCSHIFCLQCAENQGLANATLDRRICPACDTRLNNPDDVVKSVLNPSEDYKTSILSGLSPTVIMECAGRALQFYTYQTTQEIIYQEHISKALSDKYHGLNQQLDQLVFEANSEIKKLQSKLEGIQPHPPSPLVHSLTNETAVTADQQALTKRNQELVDAFREKSKSHSFIQQMYNKLKSEVLESNVATAASENVDKVLEAGGHENPFANALGSRSLASRTGHSTTKLRDERIAEGSKPRRRVSGLFANEGQRVPLANPSGPSCNSTRGLGLGSCECARHIS
ncbi:hypothetical protein BDY21DRAFT_279650 [Lineolata rhizophorae]|uniref:RING-type domain-containing protein n=1 Tax=Lineolata rhizophorae TaxID=578093 RepID=A0A6A6PBS3_9PEZI|nr:hypothetical protein BDY21DRAFT_279650 [Lineolata rhizophorae]